MQSRISSGLINNFFFFFFLICESIYDCQCHNRDQSKNQFFPTLIVNRPVRPGPLVERSGARGAVLAAQAGRARHVVVGHHRRLHRLQGLIGSVASGGAGDTVKHSVAPQTGVKSKRHTRIWLYLLLQSFSRSYPRVPRPAMGGLGGFCVGGLVLEMVPPLPAALLPCC